MPLFQAHGFADLAGGVALSSQTLFRLYSQTKPILVVGFLILFERGAVSLDDPVEKYLPEFKGASVGPKRKPLLRPMLVRDLLAHTSGIGFGPGFGPCLRFDTHTHTFLQTSGGSYAKVAFVLRAVSCCDSPSSSSCMIHGMEHMEQRHALARLRGRERLRIDLPTFSGKGGRWRDSFSG